MGRLCGLRSGGEERRITYHPDLDFPFNWTGDGQRVLIASFRHRMSLLGSPIYTVRVQGGFPTEVPVPSGWHVSLSPAGDRIATGSPSSVIHSATRRGNGCSRLTAKLSRLK